MECPFNLELAVDEEDEDPEHDKDEDQMQEKKVSSVTPIDDFLVQKKPPHISEYDEEMKSKQMKTETDAKVKAVTIDDDQPDYEKDDPYG